MHQVIPGTFKPRIRRLWGVWHCAGVAGKTPADSYENWRKGDLMKRLFEKQAEQALEREKREWLRHNPPIEWRPFYSPPPALPVPVGPPWVITCTAPH